MITAVDTNVLVDIVSRDETFGASSMSALGDCMATGDVVASEVVWAEIAAGFDDVHRFRESMEVLGLRFSAVDAASAEAASVAWRYYRAGGGPRTRIVADFLVGAHAQHQADRLLTRDRGFYRRYFGHLQIVDPSSDGTR